MVSAPGVLLATTNHERNPSVDEVGDEGNDGEGKGRNIESASGSRAGWASEATVPIQHCHSNHGSKEKQVDNGAEEGEKRDASETACE